MFNAPWPNSSPPRALSSLTVSLSRPRPMAMSGAHEDKDANDDNRWEASAYMAKFNKIQYALFLAHHVWTHSRVWEFHQWKKWSPSERCSFWWFLKWFTSKFFHVLGDFWPDQNPRKSGRIRNIWGTNGRRTRARGNLSKRTPSSSTWKGGGEIHIQTFRKFRANQPWLSMTLGSWVSMIYTDDGWWSPEDLIPLLRLYLQALLHLN